MIRSSGHSLIKLSIFIVALLFSFRSLAQNNEVDFRKEIGGVPGAVVPEDSTSAPELPGASSGSEILKEGYRASTESLGKSSQKQELTETGEENIPLTKGKKIEAHSSQTSTPKVLAILVAIVALGLGLFVYVRRHVRPSSTSSMQIKILTHHHLGPRRSLAIIRVAGESILIGITDHNISMIKSLALLDEDLPDVNETEFTESLKKVGAAQARKVDDDFSMLGVRDLVSSKLKNMRNLGL
jgi:flagellar protein FliO/FliZ